MEKNRPILVTGSHRSGTTWVGKMLALHPQTVYLKEPFNNCCPKSRLNLHFEYPFTYIGAHNETRFFPPLADLFAHKYDPKKELENHISPGLVLHTIKTYMTHIGHQLLNRRLIFKDPIAFFSAEWLAQTFDMDVVLMIRHPAAFAYSLMKKKWEFDFANFTAQPFLMKDLLGPFENEIHDFIKVKHDIIDQAALLWIIIYSLVDVFRTKHPQWHFLRHEDLSLDPGSGFKGLFSQLQLSWTDTIGRTINEYSNSNNPVESPQDIELIKRNSIANIKQWKQRLNAADIDRIRARVEPISSLFYADIEW